MSQIYARMCLAQLTRDSRSLLHPQVKLCETLKLTNMSIKSTIAALAATPLLFSGAAFAGPYVNVEANASYPDGEYSGATTDLHIGYEGATAEGRLGYYVQGGPAINHTEAGDDYETELSGKVGASYGLNESTALYGELSGITTPADDINWGAKLGAKFVF